MSSGGVLENYIETLERIEDEVASTILANHAHELAVVDAALNQIGVTQFSFVIPAKAGIQGRNRCQPS